MSTYVIENNIQKYKGSDSIKLNELYKAIDHIYSALFSTIISIKCFFENQFEQMKLDLNQKETLIKNKIIEYKNNLTSEEIGVCKKYFENLLQDWITLRYRMDVTVFYFLCGEIPDKDLINRFFKPNITHTNNINKRPLSIGDYLKGHELLREKPWNNCSSFGIINYFNRLKQADNILKELRKTNKFSSNLHEEKANEKVCFKK